MRAGVRPREDLELRYLPYCGELGRHGVDPGQVISENLDLWRINQALNQKSGMQEPPADERATAD
jgi:hypothetical protein